MTLNDILNQSKEGWQKLLTDAGILRPNQPQTNNVPQQPQTAQNEALAASQPTPTPTQTLMYRNPQMETFKKQRPKDFDELQSAAQLATQDALKRQLLMDLALEESGLNVHATNPNSTAKGAFQYIDSSAKQMGIDPFDATASARATSNALDRGNLAWWDVLNNGGATQTPLRKLYTQEELNRFLK